LRQPPKALSTTLDAEETTMTLRHVLALALPSIVLGLAGCDDTPPPPQPGLGSNPPASAPAPPPEPKTNPPAAPTETERKPREILGKRTTDIRDAQKEIQPGAAVKAPPRQLGRDPITLSGNAYVSIIGQNSILNIKHALDLYQAETGSYPKDYNEFMEQIIKKNNIALPTLPYYQEYGYDAATHSLVILEYPH
jgi:hypothetical protein